MRGVRVYDEVVGVLKVVVRGVFPFPYVKFTDRGVSAAGGGVAYIAGFK
jgi:hypothetical protein